MDFLIRLVSFFGRFNETLKVGAFSGRSMDERRNADEPAWRQTRPIPVSAGRPRADWSGEPVGRSPGLAGALGSDDAAADRCCSRGKLLALTFAPGRAGIGTTIQRFAAEIS